MARLILVRHGQTDWNAQGRYQGQTDTSLNAVGCAQAEALGNCLRSERLRVIFSSDLSRAWQTAKAIAAHHQVRVQAEPRLREISVGTWEGLTYGEILKLDPGRLAQWIEDPLTVSPPDGETLAALAARVKGVLGEMAEYPDDQTALVVSHGGTLQVLLCLALNMPPQDYWKLRLGEASLTDVYLYARAAILERLNDQHHLLGVSL